MRRTRTAATALAVLVLCGSLFGTTATAAPAASAPTVAWPSQGQAAYATAGGSIRASGGSHRAPIASLAKVMTAYVVLTRFPMRADGGFRMTVTAADVADRAMRVGRGESTVPVRRGEVLTQRQALAALLLPSANNVAVMLARRVAGSVPRFVALMNRTARLLRMLRTTYTDPSGFLASTVSTPGDQVRLALAADRRPFLRAMTARRAFWIPVAGWVRNTNELLGTAGFTGTKTGSMSQSGGCLMFRVTRAVRGRAVTVHGVVMGQYAADGYHAAAFRASRALADRVYAALRQA